MPDQQPAIDMHKSVTFSQRLTSCRETLGLERKEVAAQLRLPERIIAMLETGEIEPNLPLTFLRGYIRSYSKFLAIPEPEMQAALELLAPQPAASKAVPGIALTDTPLQTSSRLADFFLSLFKYLIGFALIVLVGVSLFTYKTNSSQHQVPAATTTSILATSDEASLSTGIPSSVASWVPSHFDSKKIISTVMMAAACALLIYLLSCYVFQQINAGATRSKQNLFIKQPGNATFFNKWLFLIVLIIITGLVYLGFNRTKQMRQNEMPIVASQHVEAAPKPSEPDINLPSTQLHAQLTTVFKTYALASLVNQLNAYITETAAIKFALTDPSTELGQLKYHPRRRHFARYHARKDYDKTIPPYYRHDHPENVIGS